LGSEARPLHSSIRITPEANVDLDECVNMDVHDAVERPVVDDDIRADKQLGGENSRPLKVDYLRYKKRISAVTSHEHFGTNHTKDAML
jgi:hypothetical protein